uniref:J domain-containing protein n=1 Tax=Romanomermis culicivorax TaxID=13658 RepID=A0A915JN43_ROMCU
MTKNQGNSAFDRKYKYILSLLQFLAPSAEAYVVTLTRLYGFQRRRTAEVMDRPIRLSSRNSSAATFDNNDDDDTTNNSSSEDDEALFDKEDKAYEKFLKNLDPTKFKEQDHYKVLGLSKLRYLATIKQVKLAYKKKVLNHHPDKRRQKGVDVLISPYCRENTVCLSPLKLLAYEFLSNIQKRRSYDSVDPTFDENIPSGTLTYKENFFKLYVPAFERNERWSNIQPCPKLGDPNSTEEEVNKFYNFWYNFDSWREFSYLDEEDKEKGENRLERRWIDKQNKASRDKRRKDELKRLRTLVDSAYKNDPRVQKFKEDEKRRKEDERLAREEERRFKQEAIEREKREAVEREEKEKARVEEEAKQKQLNEKREKEQTKKAIQRERKVLKELCQNNNYFCEKNDDSSLLTRTGHLDQFCQLFSSEQLKSLNDRLKSEIDQHHNTTNHLSSSTNQNCSKVFDEFVGVLNDMLETERRKHSSAAAVSQNKNSANSAVAAIWTTEENQLLIKAMTIFPVGTKSRWDVIAAFINEHSKIDDVDNANKKTGKDVVVKVKDVQKLDEKSKESVSKGIPLLQTKSSAQVETAPSIRT